jgi:hypothetical protein
MRWFSIGPFFILAAAGNPVIQEGSIGMMVFAV